MIKQLAVRKQPGPVFQGPFEVLKVSRTAVLTDQSPQWIHASRLKKSPQKKEAEKRDEKAPTSNCSRRDSAPSHEAP